VGILLLVALLLILTAVGYQLGRRRALLLVDHPRELNSLPGYYGSYVGLWLLLPSLLLLAGWISFQGRVIDSIVVSGLPVDIQQVSPDELGLFLNDAQNLAAGDIVSRDATPELRAAADRYVSLQ
jgi:phosphate transport system permease protein